MSQTLGSSRHEALRALIVEKRKKAGLTQAQVAKRLRRYQSFVATVEGGQREGASEAGAIGRCKSGPGKAQQAAWKRVLREAAAMPNTKRTQRLRGVCD